jgi:hypothetical protein
MTLTKVELLRQVKKFLQDPERGISNAMFAELCGINVDHMRDVFLYQTKPLRTGPILYDTLSTNSSTRTWTV